MKEIYFSGYNGRIGKNLVELLNKNGYRVIPVTRDHLNLNHKLEFNTLNEIQKSFFHFAWPLSESDYRNSDNNRSFLATSLNFLSKYKSKFDDILVPGTIFELPKHLRELSDETNPEPRCTYSESKLSLSKWLLEENFKYSWPILPYILSSNDPNFKLVPTIMNAVISGKKSVGLTSPNIKRNFVHVSECAEMISACYEVGVFGRYLIGSDTNISSSQLVKEFGLSWTDVLEDKFDSEIEQILKFTKLHKGWQKSNTFDIGRGKQLHDMLVQEQRYS
jgi:nucleoside-diphosphate-sugar epimerase